MPDGRYQMVDPYDLVMGAPTPPPFEPERTALLIIDLQYLDASRDFGAGRLAREQGRLELLKYRFDRIDEILPRVARLAQGCRQAGVQVIYIKIATMRADGRDAARPRRLPCPEGSKEAEILEEIAPQPGDLVVAKTTNSAFSTSNLDTVLRYSGIHTLIGTGVVTNGCVELTMRDAADRGYYCLLVEDCCGANSEEFHQDALRRMNRGFMKVVGSEEILGKLADYVAR